MSLHQTSYCNCSLEKRFAGNRLHIKSALRVHSTALSYGGNVAFFVIDFHLVVEWKNNQMQIAQNNIWTGHVY